jgi:hypothetical protein
MRFTLPFRARVVGMQFIGMNVAASDFAFAIYSDAGAELQRNTKDGDHSMMTLAPHKAFFSAPVILEPETPYRMTQEPTTTAALPFAKIILPSSMYQAAMPWRGRAAYTSFHLAAWTEDPAAWCQMQLLIDQIDAKPARAGFSLGA